MEGGVGLEFGRDGEELVVDFDIDTMGVVCLGYGMVH